MDYSGAAKNVAKLRGMSRLVHKYNFIRNLLKTTSKESKDGDQGRIKLPQIVVIGAQSSGKSSVLEALVGFPFLPRGTGLVTRCPILIQMINIGEGKPWSCKFDHKPTETFNDSRLVEEEITRKTNELTKSPTDISEEQINMTFYSPDVLNLTLVDLPGLTNSASNGQDASIPEKIRGLARSFITQENTVILAISNGNDDIENSISIPFAKEADPNQERTIAVLTKLDLPGDKEKLYRTLKGEIIQMNMGIVGVVNRSLEEVIRGKPHSEVIADEEKFFSDNFPDIKDLHGIEFLGNKLSDLFHKQIADVCKGTKLVDQVRRDIRAFQKQLASLGNSDDLKNDAEKRSILIKEIQSFSKAYEGHVHGQQKRQLSAKTPTKGVNLRQIYNVKLEQMLDALEQSELEDMSEEAMLIAVNNTKHLEGRIADPQPALDLFVKEQISKMCPTALEIANLCYQQMEAIIGTCLKVNPRFPQLNEAFETVIKKLLEENMQETENQIEKYFEIASISGFTSDKGYDKKFVSGVLKINQLELSTLLDDLLQHGPEGFPRRQRKHSFQLCASWQVSFFELPGSKFKITL